MTEKVISAATKQKKRELCDLGIYIHIPFCAKKCDYCDFLSAPADSETKISYKKALITQIESYHGRTGGYQVPTIFIGGGTPSCLEANDIEEIMAAVARTFSLDKKRLEATIEVNPGILSAEKLSVYKRAGINRLSFGLQSADDKELKLLGRIHSYDQFLQNYCAARELGFDNINVDLMSALPGQTADSWEKTLTRVIGLEPEHISAYSLIIEEGTPFARRFGKGMPEEHLLPDEDEDRLIYHMTKDILLANGYHRYEISNYARKGFECRHNSSYWTGTQYLGLGLGASSLLAQEEEEYRGCAGDVCGGGASPLLIQEEEKREELSLVYSKSHIPGRGSSPLNYENLNSEYLRFHIENDLNEYIRLCCKYSETKSGETKSETKSGPKENQLTSDPIGLQREIQPLSDKDRMEEFMFLGLRLCSGISKVDFLGRFHIPIEDVYGSVIQKLIDQNLLEEAEDRLKLTDYGIDVSNIVLAEFLLGE